MEPRKKLGPEQRIRRQTTFKFLVEKGRFVRGEFFYLWVVRRKGGGCAAAKNKPMVAVIVSRKTDVRAVGRNLWKRRVKEIFREQQARLHQDVACLVKVRETKTRPSFASAQEDLMKLFKKAGAWA